MLCYSLILNHIQFYIASGAIVASNSSRNLLCGKKERKGEYEEVNARGNCEDKTSRNLMDELSCVLKKMTV